MLPPLDSQNEHARPVAEYEEEADPWCLRQIRQAEERLRITEDGVEALKRLMAITQSNSGQCRIIALFVLGLYNGSDNPFNLNYFRILGEAHFLDCLRVLRLDVQVREKEVHEYFENGGEIFIAIAERWDIDIGGEQASY